MNFEEYKKQVQELEKQFQVQKKILMVSFVDDNNKYKVGDIVTDHIGSIKIEAIKYSWGFSPYPPCAVYEGVELKKDLTPVKRNTKREVYQSNIV